MLALINLFVCVLQRPLAPAIQSDIATIEIAAGYFAQMEIATMGTMTFPFTKKAASMAQRAVDCARANLDNFCSGGALDSTVPASEAVDRRAPPDSVSSRSVKLGFSVLLIFPPHCGLLTRVTFRVRFEAHRQILGPWILILEHRIHFSSPWTLKTVKHTTS